MFSNSLSTLKQSPIKFLKIVSIIWLLSSLDGFENFFFRSTYVIEIVQDFSRGHQSNEPLCVLRR